MARIVLICALVLTGASGCGGSDRSGGGGVTVVAAFYPLAFVASQVAAEGVSVTNLTPAGAEPHDLELTARDVDTVREADVVLYVGGGFMPGLERALAGARGRAHDVLAWVDVRSGSSAGEGDPHVWLDPRRLAEIARRVGADLGRPAQGSEVAERLLRLDEELERGLARCERRDLVTSHAAFGYLAQRYGLVELPLEGLAPEAEPSAREIAVLVEEIRARGATTVFTEPLVSSRLADAVAREAGVRTAILDPIEGLTGDQVAAGADYVSVMRSNLAALRGALGCS